MTDQGNGGVQGEQCRVVCGLDYCHSDRVTLDELVSIALDTSSAQFLKHSVQINSVAKISSQKAKCKVHPQTNIFTYS